MTTIRHPLALKRLLSLLQRLPKRHDLRPLEADVLARLQSFGGGLVGANVDELVALVLREGYPDRLLSTHARTKEGTYILACTKQNGRIDRSSNLDVAAVSVQDQNQYRCCISDYVPGW